MWTMHTGEANGRMSLKFKGMMQAADVLRFHPEIQTQLDQIVNRGWKYLFIEVMGTAVTELDAKGIPCRIRASTSFNSRSLPPPPILELNLGMNPLDLTGMPEVQEFRINVCSKSFPRAATVDLATGRVTYIHDPFWKWDRAWGADQKKLSDAKEVYEVATWLIDEKKLTLAEAFDQSRYQELAGQFKTFTA